MDGEQRNPSSPSLQRLSFETDAGEGARARMGLLVLESDQTVEAEFRALLNPLPDVSVYHARLANDTQVTPETLARMEEELPVAAALIPGYMGLSVVGYGCTSGSTIIGEDRVAEIITTAHPGAAATNPLTAAKAALAALGVQNLALLTPYTPDVTLAMQANFAHSGVSVRVVGSFFEDSDAVVGKIAPQSILDAALEVGSDPSVDGVFISCTSLRAVGIIEAAEATLDKPVTASNHALAWHMMRLSGIDDALPGRGRLFQTGLA